MIDALSPLPEHLGVPNDPESTTASIHRWKDGELQPPSDDKLAVEEPLEIRVRGQNVAVTMRTPGHDDELATGFLATEGLIKNREDVTEIAHCKEGEAAQLGNTLNVFLAPNVEVDMESLTRHVFASSSCGVCGKATIEAVQQNFPPVVSEMQFSPEIITGLPAKLREAQATFEQTGGLHAAAIFDARGKLLVLREDVGRHNAVDKVVGFGLLNDVSFAECLLMVSGRASFEIMQKALAAQVPIVAAVSAPSSLAVEFAQESGQTLIGFLRGETMNIYSRAERTGS
mgnify:CR=1 FL=1